MGGHGDMGTHLVAMGTHWVAMGPNLVATGAHLVAMGPRGATRGPGAAFGAALVTALWRQGLDLTQCSMYEDISQRPQPTYQDVGTAGDSGAGLEKP